MDNLCTKNGQTIENQRIENFFEKQVVEKVPLRYEQTYDPDKKQVCLYNAQF